MVTHPAFDKSGSEPVTSNGIITIVLIYAAFAGLWILLSDKLVAMLFIEPRMITLASMLKGWLFVLVTSILLYGLIHRLADRTDDGATRSPPHYGLPFTLLAMVVVVLTLVGISHVARNPQAGHAATDALWIELAGVLSLFITGLGFHLLRQNQALALARAVEQSQNERLRALHLLVAIADGSEDAVFAKDQNGNYILFNRAASRFVGKPSEAVLGHGDSALFPPEQAARLLALDRLIMADNQPHNREEVLNTAFGTITFQVYKAPLHDEAGQVIGVFGISRDITAQKASEAALHRQVELNQRYLDTMQNIMVALDRQGRITMINRKGCQILGYAEDELLGQDWFATCLPDPRGRQEAYPVYQRILSSELRKEEFHEGPVLCRDGHQRLIAWHIAGLIDATGQVVGTLSSGEDITERKADERALRSRNAELERFNRASVGRELEIIAFKKRINALSLELGREPPYPLAFVDPEPGGRT